MHELQVEYIDGRKILSYSLDREVLDTFCVGMIVNNNIEGVVPFKYTDNGGVRRLEYDVTEYEDIKQYTKGIMNKKSFLNMYKDVVAALTDASEYMLEYRMFLLKTQYIYVDKDGKCNIVCLPVKNTANTEELSSSLMQLITNTSYDMEEDTSYVVSMINYLNENRKIICSELLKFINKLENEQAVKKEQVFLPNTPFVKEENTMMAVSTGNNIIEVPAAEEILPEIKPVEFNDNPFSPEEFNLPDIDLDDEKKKKDKKGFFGFAVKKHKDELVDPYGSTTVLGNDDYNAGTTVLGNSSIGPRLIRKKNNEVIYMDKPIFRIGKEASYADYYIGDNPAISRAHAEIVSENGNYYIIDNNSLNHTYVNEIQIQSQIRFKIDDMTNIRLANEEFEFRV